MVPRAHVAQVALGMPAWQRQQGARETTSQANNTPEGFLRAVIW